MHFQHLSFADYFKWCIVIYSDFFVRSVLILYLPYFVIKSYRTIQAEFRFLIEKKHISKKKLKITCLGKKPPTNIIHITFTLLGCIKIVNEVLKLHGISHGHSAFLPVVLFY